jgi:hypothetical protein
MEEDRIAVDVAMVIQFAEGARSIKLYNDDDRGEWQSGKSAKAAEKGLERFVIGGRELSHKIQVNVNEYVHSRTKFQQQ